MDRGHHMAAVVDNSTSQLSEAAAPQIFSVSIDCMLRDRRRVARNYQGFVQTVQRLHGRHNRKNVNAPANRKFKCVRLVSIVQILIRTGSR